MGCSSAHVRIVNAEVDSMGGVVEGGVGIAIKSSPHKVAIEKVQVELRQECGVRDERRRELEFLEKGGNPLEYDFGTVASVSVQSTSVTNQNADQFVTSEAKGSLAFTASPRRDSVESCGRPGTTLCDPNSADNLLLFEAENEFSEGSRSRRSSVKQSDQSFQMDVGLKTREQGDSATFSLPRKAYKRRNRSWPNRDGARLSSTSTDVNPAQGLHETPLPFRHVPKDVEVLSSDANNQNIRSNLNSKPTSPSNDILPKAVATDCEAIGLDELRPSKSTKDQVQGVSLDTASDVIANQQSLLVVADTRKQIDSNEPEAIKTVEMASAAIVCQPSATTLKVENQSSSCQTNDFSRKIGDDTITDIHRNNDSEMCTVVGNLDSNGNPKNQYPQDGTTVPESDKFGKETNDTEENNSSAFTNNESASARHSKPDEDSLLAPNELDQVESSLQDKVKDQGQPKERHQETFDPSKSELPDFAFSNRVSTISTEAQTSPGSDSKLESSVDEDSVLKEAQIIEAKRKRIAELSVVTSPVEISQKCHWDYVLEEMTWLANDFAQERIWKLAAASQISYQVAVVSHLRKQESRPGLDAKRVAHTLAKAVMEFWHSIELQAHETSKEQEQHCRNNGALSIRAYAVSFLKCDKPDVFYNQAEVPVTPDRISDSGIDLSWDDSLTEENLFYTVAPGAVEAYRMTIVSHLAQYERIGSSAQEEVETFACDAAADIESHYNEYDEDEGETNIYSMPMAFDSTKSSRYGQKKRRHLVQAYGARPYELGSDLLPMQSSENRLVAPQFAILAKRPGSNINVSIPTKRMRTASRRVISPFGVGASGCIQAPNKTDASSCDTNSFQDDQTTVRGGYAVPNSLEVDSAGEFEKQLPNDYAEVSTKPKKKKNAKHLNSTYEQRWPIDSSFQNEQFHRDLYQKRTEINQPDSNGNNGLLGQHIAKKPKLMRQSQDNTFDSIPPSALSVPSPVGSQMSNMSNQNQFIRMLSGRDRGRKPKSLKMPSGQSGSGSLWSLFEDQALVVLAHDLGPNWELVSDAFNSTLHFKQCIFRKAKECKERHISLMDRGSGDGADSADDSGSLQPYPSTLPGIPKGSARQLFQRLQGPMEEDTLKSHFEKIVVIGQKQIYRKTQNDNQDPKQFQRPHTSHMIALSQVCPNNQNGGTVLTPLDLCDANLSGPDVVPLGYQGALSSGLAIPNQATTTQTLPASGATAALQGASHMTGNNLSSSPGPLNTSTRDARYGLPRSGSLPAEEHQRMHLYNQMITGRNIPQSSISAPGAVPGPDRSARMLSSGNGMGMMSGANRNMPIARPAVQGIPSSSMVNSGTAVSPGLSSGNMHTGVGAGQGSSIVRPSEASNIQRPGQSQDPQRQMMASDLQTLGNSPGVSHVGGLSSSFTNSTTSPPVPSHPLHHQPPHPISPQQPQVLSPHQSHFQGPANHAPNNQQQAYAYRLAKERQLQHRFLQQQHQQLPQQFASSNSVMSHVQSQTQLPVSAPPMLNSPQAQPQTSSPTVPLSPSTPVPSMNTMPQHQQKPQMPTQGVSRNAQSGGSGLNNQTGKQRARQPHQPSQANRQHPQQRQQLQAQQQAKVKGAGRGMQQNISTDVVLPNGVSTIPGNQCLEKAEPVTSSMQSQGLSTGSAQNAVQPSRQYMASQSNQALPQQKMYSGQPTPQPDNSSQSHGPSASPSVSSAPQQSSSSVAVAGPNNQTPSHQTFLNQNQPALQRLGQPIRQIMPNPLSKPHGRYSNVNHHPASGSAGTDAMTTPPQISNIGSNAVPVVSQPSSHKWHASEPLVDSNSLNSPQSLVSIPSNSSDPVPQEAQGLGPRPPSRLPIARHDTNAQRQQLQQSLQAPSPAPQPQQHQQPLQPLHSQQQAQLLQAGSGNMYGRSSDTRLE
ncbi:chromatin modification-related protein EAF1 B-like isoform X7 [Salvia hispanica]|uniref:chromatin modification-related protein EAF1 B-like isoform X7 n=1 Tax=Salvia hispanica TaxID=49212 RepID=UPI0020091720|nr:chromatin modification-related protein EAF1 B-like isoform X7 [Salvia hispanica]